MRRFNEGVKYGEYAPKTTPEPMPKTPYGDPKVGYWDSPDEYERAERPIELTPVPKPKTKTKPKPKTKPISEAVEAFRAVQALAESWTPRSERESNLVHKHLQSLARVHKPKSREEWKKLHRFARALVPADDRGPFNTPLSRPGRGSKKSRGAHPPDSPAMRRYHAKQRHLKSLETPQPGQIFSMAFGYGNY